MSLGNWAQSFLRDVAGGFFGNDYLRDYTHASKTFRTNSYQNAPKLKFLFHTYFETNFQAFPNNFNYGLLVKEVKLPSFSFDTHQLNQYNRKRIVQTKIKYDPIDITFHDDNNDSVNLLWNSYYQYYYNDGSKPKNVLQGFRGSALGEVDPYGTGNATLQYNDRNIYDNDIGGDDDWGFSGGQTDPGSGKKVAFFKNITVFGFNQHNFTAYTFINPMITNFSHDNYSYDDGNGVMQDKMTIDYETVVYNYGKMDGRKPGDIVTGFGDEATYDRNVSPIANPGANGTVLGQGGLVDAAGGAMRALGEGDALGAIKTAGVTYNAFKNVNLKSVATAELTSMLKNTLQNTPNTRNTLFSFPKAGSSPGPVGTAGFPTINARTSPPIITDLPSAGTQNNGSETAGSNSTQQPGTGVLPIDVDEAFATENYLAALGASDGGDRGDDFSGDAASEINAILRDLESGDSASEINAILKDLDNPLAKDYKIKKGDNLTKIAKENNTTVAELLKENPKIKNPNLIYAGETIKVPTGKAAADPTYNNTDQDVFNEDEQSNPDLDADIPDPDLDEDI